MSDKLSSMIKVEKEFMNTLVRIAEKEKLVLTERQKRVLPILTLKTAAACKKQSEQIIQISSQLCKGSDNIANIVEQVKILERKILDQ